MRRAGILLAGLLLVLVPAAQAQVIAPEFSDSYSFRDLGPPRGVPPNLGGLTLLAGSTDRLLIGGAANTETGALYEIGVVRDPDGHITAFSDEPATRFADAAYNDGGVAYGPGGVLFLARYPETTLGQTKPDSTTTDKVIDLRQHGVSGSLGALTFVPAGHPGAGSLKLASYSGGQWYDAEVMPDGNGTYDLVNVTPVEGAVLAGPEGIAYVNPGSAGFDAPSVLVSEYGMGRVSAYPIDGEGDPVVATRRDFITGLTGAEGAFVDPVTGDFLFSTYGGGNRVIVVQGFARAATLNVVTKVVNDDLGTSAPENFKVHVRRDGVDVDGSPQPGDEAGTIYTLAGGIEHSVEGDPLPGYDLTMSGDCPDGRVVPEEGVQKICTITADDADAATLTVTTQVDGGGWLPEDFTVHVTSSGFDAVGPQPGSDKGAVYAVPGGTYVVSSVARGYIAKLGGACAADGTVTLEPGESKSCTIANSVVPVGDGLVVESYGAARTDGDWGLTEPFLLQTRGFLEDPANFGPNGVVQRVLRVTPGIRVANARTLAGVDVLFTGWVPTSSYTDAERDALRAFVLGGGTLIATTDDTGHTVVDLFGLTQGDGFGDPTQNTITDPGHPIANGAFGAVTGFNQYAATGHYPTLGPDAVEVGRNAQGASLAVIERGALGGGSGTVILAADVDVFSDHGGAGVNATLIKNLFAFAAGVDKRPMLSIGDAVAGEGNTGSATLTFMVSLTTSSSFPVRVRYSTADDTAAAPSDYVAAAGEVVFAPGETAKPVPIAVNGDALVEADERFKVNLSAPGGAPLADAQGVGTITNDDVATVTSIAPPPIQPPPPPEQELPPPVPGEQVNAVPKSGTVKVKLKGTKRFVELEEGQQVPVGSVIDTTKGRITLVAASDKSGGTATADFYAGIFEVGQTKGAKPITTLELVERLSCGSARASAAAKRKKKRRLWGDGSGRFRTEGSYSSATVRGTRWLVEDRCTNTLTRVAVGRVAVRDFARRKTVIVRAGRQYVARRSSG